MSHWERLRSFDLNNMDYPGTAYFVRANNFLRPQTPRVINYVVIHITGGPAMTESSAVNEFLVGPASAHYIVNREGTVIQMVQDLHIANHVGGLYSITNSESIGIEHVNPYRGNTRMRPTERQYAASAGLVRWLCQRYGIRMSHELTPRGQGIKGHSEAAPAALGVGHANCPNPAWDWDYYINLLNNPQPLDVVLQPVLQL